MNNFKVNSLEYEQFSDLFELDKQALENFGAMKIVVDSKPGFPCRVSLEDADIGEEVLLLNYKHHPANSPYQATGPIYIRRNSQSPKLTQNELPQMLKHRLLSLRVYDKNGMMKEALVANGDELKSILSTVFTNPAVSYVHIHNAAAGCYNCSVDRVS